LLADYESTLLDTMTGTAYLSQAIDKKNIVPFFWPFLLRLTLRLANNAIMNEKDF
jgi:hypothetical protein